MLSKLKNLIILLALITSTVCLGQKDSVTCLYNKQVDFLILEHIDAEYLRKDSIRLNNKINILYQIIEAKDRQSDNWVERVNIKEQEIVATNKFNSYLVDKYNKSQKWQKFFKNTTVIFISTTLILTGVLLITN